MEGMNLMPRIPLLSLGHVRGCQKMGKGRKIREMTTGTGEVCVTLGEDSGCDEH